MIKKLGLLMLSCTLWNRVWMVCCWDLWPLRRYFEMFGSAICNTHHITLKVNIYDYVLVVSP